MSMNRGSLSVEATAVMGVFLVFVLYVLAHMYGTVYFSHTFHETTAYIIGNNRHFIDERVLNQEISTSFEDGYLLRFGPLIEEYPFLENGFLHASEEVVYITDTGSYYHRPSCPTVRLSLRPVRKVDMEGVIGPCSVCH